MEGQLLVRPGVHLPHDRHAEHLVTGETRPAGAGIPLAGREEVLLGEGRDARFFIQQCTHRLELSRMQMRDGTRRECELFMVTHPAVPPKWCGWFLDNSNVHHDRENTIPGCVTFPIQPTSPTEFQDGH